jgi:ferric-dicitrate binding protein FerR (iron transport regulator)
MAGENIHRDFERLLVRYLSGELNPEEQAWFQEELRKDPGKQDLLSGYRRIWDGAVPEVRYDLDAEWADLQSKIPGSRPASRSLRTLVFRIAAVLVLGLVLSLSGIYVSRMQGTVRVLAGDQPVEVILEDGSEVIVNRNSVLRYSRSFAQGERKVKLSGEAWFQVARDTSRPFIIDAGAALVEVLGTSFNVNAYRQNPTVEITVESGLVALSSKANQEDQIVMQAGAAGSYNKSRKQLKLIPSSDPNSMAWKTRELFFDGSSLQEVCAVVNKVYGVQLVIMNEALLACPITVTFRDQSLESVLKVLESTLDLQITRDGEKIVLDGDACVE